MNQAAAQLSARNMEEEGIRQLLGKASDLEWNEDWWQHQQGDGRFYVLAVSQNRVRLLEGTQFAVSELEAEGLPSDLRSALNIDQYVSSLQQHSTGNASTAGSMMFHGQGGSDPDIKKKDEILQTFPRINSALSDFLNDVRVPPWCLQESTICSPISSKHASRRYCTTRSL